MAIVFLGIGTNLGDKASNLERAILAIALDVGKVMRQSAFHESKPWGFDSDNSFLNAVLQVDTPLLPVDLLGRTQRIEAEMGRSAKTESGYSDRIIDVDILFYDNLILNLPALKIPHPLVVERDFVMIPMVEIAPNFIHPVLLKTMIEILNQ